MYFAAKINESKLLRLLQAYYVAEETYFYPRSLVDDDREVFLFRDTETLVLDFIPTIQQRRRG